MSWNFYYPAHCSGYLLPHHDSKRSPAQGCSRLQASRLLTVNIITTLCLKIAVGSYPSSTFSPALARLAFCSPPAFRVFSHHCGLVIVQSQIFVFNSQAFASGPQIKAAFEFVLDRQTAAAPKTAYRAEYFAGWWYGNIFIAKGKDSVEEFIIRGVSLIAMISHTRYELQSCERFSSRFRRWASQTKLQACGGSFNFRLDNIRPF
ncbi:hypothetical protein DFH29DRAFT_422954 [Suillus ampliporus]|nr:hypothetical protein DFH29DRAFT_422954 [Suillus ampliporus]